MSDIAISIDKLSKAYRLGLKEEIPDTLLRAAGSWLKTPFRNLHRLGRLNTFQTNGESKHEDDIVWAIKDISFDVAPGEVVGIIGGNGAGKSTLLKILSRVTQPTSGGAIIHGRVSSLLEVGTGFHPELSGRENVYMNGTILGMRKHEIDQKFDEIVDFSGVERFLDTPVKRYSSGMKVRLAFAVAAHLEPEILVIDEVLAVGDAEFQKRCLGKMQDVATNGRTVLFVSHNMPAIAALCSRAICLRAGRIAIDGVAEDVITRYLVQGQGTTGEVIWESPEDAPGGERVWLHAVRIVSCGQTTSEVDIAKPVDVEIEFWNLKGGAALNVSIHILDRMGAPVLASANFASATSITDDWSDRKYPLGLFRTTCQIPANFLNEGQYSINALILTNISSVVARANEAVSFRAYDCGEMRREFLGGWIGVVRPKLPWQTVHLDELDCQRSNELAEVRK